MARNVEILEPPIEGPSVRESEPMIAGVLSKDGGNDRGLPMPRHLRSKSRRTVKLNVTVVTLKFDVREGQGTNKGGRLGE